MSKDSGSRRRIGWSACLTAKKVGRMLSSSLVVVALLAVSAGNLSAQTQVPVGDELEVPSALQSWQSWVLHDNRRLDCASTPDGKACTWPGVLTLRTDSAGASFDLRVWQSRSGTVDLPGNAELWPHGLRASGAELVLQTTSDDRPSVRLPAGSHRIRGGFQWTEAPSRLQIPSSIASVRYIRRGDKVEQPTIDYGSGETYDLYLEGAASTVDGEGPGEEGGGEQANIAENSVSLEIHRRLKDGVPFEVTTNIRLVVSGDRRTIELGAILPEGARPVAFESGSSDLVVRRIDGREVDVHAGSGDHTLRIQAQYATPPESLTVPSRATSFYPEREFWAWEPAPDVRSVEFDGLDYISPDQTTLPEEWRGGTAFLAPLGEVLTMETTNRGIRPGPNALNLNRDIHLLQNGLYVFRDQINGSMEQDWRLDYGGAGDLGRVTDTERDELRLITRPPGASGEERDVAGVEQRQRDVSLEAATRVEDGFSSSAFVGWNFVPERLRTQLHLPPGWSFLYATGVDDFGAGSWMEAWSLWNVFVLVLIAGLIGRVLGWPWGVVGAVVLFGCHVLETGPFWMWAFVVGAIPLARLELTGAAESMVELSWVVFAGFFCLLMGWFAYGHIHQAVYPQGHEARALESTPFSGFSLFLQQRKAMEAPDRFREFAVNEKSASQRPGSPSAGSAEGVGAAGDASKSKKEKAGDVPEAERIRQQLQPTGPDAVKQTGPGIPEESASTVSLVWSGEVSRDHRVTVWLLPPWMLTSVLLVHLALGLLLGWRVLLKSARALANREGSSLATWRERLRSLIRGGGALVIGLIAAGAMSLAAPDLAVAQENSGRAQMSAAFPPQSLLDTLETRLEQQHQCDGPCVRVPHAALRAEGDQLMGELEVHAQRPAAVPLPGTGERLRVRSVEVDGTQMYRWRGGSDGATHVRVAGGKHTVSYAARLPSATTRQRLPLNFPMGSPRHVSFQSEDWRLEEGSLQSYGRPRDVIMLIPRTNEATSGDSEGEAEESAEGETGQSRVEPWYRVERTLKLRLPPVAETTVTREETSTSEVIDVPIVEGARVMTAGMTATDGEVSLEFNRGVSERTFISRLEDQRTLELTAPSDRPWNEVWSVECGEVWHCEYSELPRVRLFDENQYVPLWKPHPGESLTIELDRPAATEGHSMTVRSLEYTADIEQRMMTGRMRFVVQASQRGKRELTLPKAAELQSLNVDGTERSNRSLEEGKLTVDIPEGESEVSLRWQQSWSPFLFDELPAVELDAPAANVRVGLSYNSATTPLVLATGGPDWGTYSLLWLEILGLIVAGLVLGRLSAVPLNSWEWMLFGAGLMLTAGYAYTIMLVFATFVAFGLRPKLDVVRDESSTAGFNAIQVLLVCLVVWSVVEILAAGFANFFATPDEIGNLGLMTMWYDPSTISWYVNATSGVLPRPWVLGVPTWTWKLFGVAWAGWIVWRLPSWSSWIWERFTEGGVYRTPKFMSATFGGDRTEESTDADAMDAADEGPVDVDDGQEST